jgi:hypothetical protein
MNWGLQGAELIAVCLRKALERAAGGERYHAVMVRLKSLSQLANCGSLAARAWGMRNQCSTAFIRSRTICRWI